MIENFVRIAFRNLWKHRVYSFLNIVGLSIGMAACYLIFLYVRFERSYDTFNTKADRIYRLVTDLKLPGIEEADIAVDDQRIKRGIVDGVSG
jgi:putative ABC transport system permease protein